MGNTTRKAVEAVESDAYLGDGEDSPDLEAVDDQDALSPSSTADSATQFAPVCFLGYLFDFLETNGKASPSKPFRYQQYVASLIWFTGVSSQ